MKQWFSDGEWDIDMMIRFGMLTPTTVVSYCLTLTDSPWHGWAL